MREGTGSGACVQISSNGFCFKRDKQCAQRGMPVSTGLKQWLQATEGLTINQELP